MTSTAESRRYRWLEKTTALLYVIFCFELGIFLLVFPWFDHYWANSYFSNFGFAMFGQEWEKVWDSSWFRGAVSGLGLVNIFISFVEVFRLRRFSEPSEDEDDGDS